MLWWTRLGSGIADGFYILISSTFCWNLQTDVTFQKSISQTELSASFVPLQTGCTYPCKQSLATMPHLQKVVLLILEIIIILKVSLHFDWEVQLTTHRYYMHAAVKPHGPWSHLHSWDTRVIKQCYLLFSLATSVCRSICHLWPRLKYLHNWINHDILQGPHAPFKMHWNNFGWSINFIQ